jgi:hypothetical protein
MAFVVTYYVAVIITSVAVLASGKTVLETAVGTEGCLENINRYSCLSSTYSKDLIEIGRQCGSNYTAFVENSAAQCITNDDGDFCFGVFSELNVTEGATCALAEDSSCPASCREFLEATIATGECCFSTVFNERFSRLVFGYNIQAALVACSVEAPLPCESEFDITVPDDAESCSLQQFWGRVVKYLCSPEVGQPYVDDILKNPECTPIARHFVNLCGQGPSERLCLGILQRSYPLVNPTQGAYAHPVLSEAISQCANYSSFASEMCPESCKSALKSAIDEFGCCINLFNDTVNEVLLPHFGRDVMIACGLDPPGLCENDIVLGRESGTAVSTAIAAWIYLCLTLLAVYL